MNLKTIFTQMVLVDGFEDTSAEALAMKIEHDLTRDIGLRIAAASRLTGRDIASFREMTVSERSALRVLAEEFPEELWNFMAAIPQDEVDAAKKRHRERKQLHVQPVYGFRKN